MVIKNSLHEAQEPLSLGMGHYDPSPAKVGLMPRVNHFISPLLVDIPIDSRYNSENCFPPETRWVGLRT